MRPLVNRGGFPRSLWRLRSPVCGFALARPAGNYFQDVRMRGAFPVIGSAIVLLAAAVIASLLPAARAARVDVMEALRSD